MQRKRGMVSEWQMPILEHRNWTQFIIQPKGAIALCSIVSIRPPKRFCHILTVWYTTPSKHILIRHILVNYPHGNLRPSPPCVWIMCIQSIVRKYLHLGGTPVAILLPILASLGSLPASRTWRYPPYTVLAYAGVF